jgi:hypothetical protein
MARIDIKTAQVTTGAGTWHELQDLTGPFGIAPNSAVVQFTIGHEVPSTAVSVTLPVGASFELLQPVSGPVYVMTASAGRVDWYAA